MASIPTDKNCSSESSEHKDDAEEQMECMLAINVEDSRKVVLELTFAVSIQLGWVRWLWLLQMAVWQLTDSRQGHRAIICEPRGHSPWWLGSWQCRRLWRVFSISAGSIGTLKAVSTSS